MLEQALKDRVTAEVACVDHRVTCVVVSVEAVVGEYRRCSYHRVKRIGKNDRRNRGNVPKDL